MKNAERIDAARREMHAIETSLLNPFQRKLFTQAMKTLADLGTNLWEQDALDRSLKVERKIEIKFQRKVPLVGERKAYGNAETVVISKYMEDPDETRNAVENWIDANAKGALILAYNIVGGVA